MHQVANLRMTGATRASPDGSHTLDAGVEKAFAQNALAHHARRAEYQDVHEWIVQLIERLPWNPTSRREKLSENTRSRRFLSAPMRVRCIASGAVWVGASRNLDATRNGCWFTLRSGSHVDKPLQQEWNAHGEAAFQYEILETLEGDLHPIAIADLLKQSRQRWVEQLNARPLL